jgi:hypothetical protein
MNNTLKKTLLSLFVFGAIESAFALDSGAQNLTATVGATDYFKINCTGDTDHLNFKLLENAVAEIKNETTDLNDTVIEPVLNAKLTKLKLNAMVSNIAAGTNKEVSLKGGNGTYTLTLDTFGTNLTLKNSQTYSVQYQCLNTAEKITAGSSTLTKLGIESKPKTLANSKTAKYAITCSGKTDHLKVKIINKTAITKTSSAAQMIETPASGNLMAQILKAFSVLNTTGEVLNLQAGNGDYFVMVNSPINAVKNYRFQYSCLNASNIETKTSLIQTLQNQ